LFVAAKLLWFGRINFDMLPAPEPLAQRGDRMRRHLELGPFIGDATGQPIGHCNPDAHRAASAPSTSAPRRPDPPARSRGEISADLLEWNPRSSTHTRRPRELPRGSAWNGLAAGTSSCGRSMPPGARVVRPFAARPSGRYHTSSDSSAPGTCVGDLACPIGVGDGCRVMIVRCWYLRERSENRS
jgi:hypothetical protein